MCVGEIVRGKRRKEKKRKSVRAGGHYNCESDFTYFPMSHTAALDTTPTLTQGAAEI